MLGNGLSFDPIMLKPSEAQWLENQQFTTTQIARLFGIPADMLLAAVEGSSLTYSNLEQKWIEYLRTTLTGYIRKIEDAFTQIVPRGQTVRMNIEAILRVDTKTRYESHGLALQNGWMTRDEVREIENLPPLTAAQKEELKSSTPTKTPITAGVDQEDG